MRERIASLDNVPGDACRCLNSLFRCLIDRGPSEPCLPAFVIFLGSAPAEPFLRPGRCTIPPTRAVAVKAAHLRAREGLALTAASTAARSWRYGARQLMPVSHCFVLIATAYCSAEDQRFCVLVPPQFDPPLECPKQPISVDAGILGLERLE